MIKKNLEKNSITFVITCCIGLALLHQPPTQREDPFSSEIVSEETVVDESTMVPNYLLQEAKELDEEMRLK